MEPDRKLVAVLFAVLKHSFLIIIQCDCCYGTSETVPTRCQCAGKFLHSDSLHSSHSREMTGETCKVGEGGIAFQIRVYFLIVTHRFKSSTKHN